MKSTKYYEFYNANPSGKEIGDCAIRCIALALDVSWLEAFDMLSVKAKALYEEMSEAPVVSEVLKDGGFTEMKVSVKKGSKRPTMITLIKENPGKVIVGQIAHHWTAAKGGKVKDLWNSSERPLYKYWIK